MSKPIPLAHGRYYHIFNRGTNGENIFKEERNYAHFLRLYAHHITPLADTFAYCLMLNHFHLLVRIADARDPKGLPNRSGLKSPTPSQAFANLFNAYTKAINAAYVRTGSLFEHPFGRITVNDDHYFARLIVYIHRNPQRHGFVADFRDWPYSSYAALASLGQTRLRRDDVLAWFGGVGEFDAAHQVEPDSAALGALLPDDFE